ncbi:hypothetical protein LCGC14_1128130 [marine sediment metagenome]|uniref:DNA-directed DNA polymerase family A palm domain-containing protein n=1 Tax=marine sediment metagenome TaxID=412755 RepID=A0A0F9M6P1_9ZZZZ
MSVEAYGNYGSRGLPEILQELTSAGIVGVDTETHSIEDKTMIGLSIASSPEYGVWFSEDSPYLHIALSILRNPKITKVLHNSKFDFDVLEPFGIDETNFEDPMILAYTLHLPLKLYTLAQNLGATIEAKYVDFKIPTKGTMLEVWQASPDFVIQKCCIDASLALWCWYRLLTWIVPSYYIDRNIVHVLRNMEQAGVALNQESVNEYYEELTELTTYLRQLISTKGCDPNSNTQVGIALAQRGWRLPYTKGGKDGKKKQLRVDEKTIIGIDDPLAQSVLIYREKAKLLNTYAKPLLGLERAYTTYNNTRVVTGRLSSSDPINMQNIPDYFRGVYMADTRFWSYDASQIELRALAYMAQDKVMMKAFEDGEDIHKATMDKMGITGNLADPVDARRLAKVLNFAVSYLGEEETIITNAKKEGIVISPQEATGFRVRYAETYPGIRDYVWSQREQITKKGFVTTLYGRVRKADQLRMSRPHSRENVIREMFNMPIQGTASEVIKMMMAKAYKYDLRIQVHDEIVYDGKCPPESLLMGLAPFDTPLKLSVGQSWGDLTVVSK